MRQEGFLTASNAINPAAMHIIGEETRLMLIQLRLELRDDLHQVFGIQVVLVMPA
jgi:hypothetical protein